MNYRNVTLILPEIGIMIPKNRGTYVNIYHQNYSQSSIESVYNTLLNSFSTYAVQDLTDILSSAADEPFSKSSTEYKILLGNGSVLTYGGSNNNYELYCLATRFLIKFYV